MTSVESTTNGFRVTALSKFIPERSNDKTPLYLFGYWISIHNISNDNAKLIKRYWKITDSDGRINEISGNGVIGKKPTIEPGKIFRYNSFCPLSTTFGFMNGNYKMVRNDNTTFEIEIPQFRLSIPKSEN